MDNHKQLLQNAQNKKEVELMKSSIQFISSLLILIFSTFVAWYEGSTIRDNPWEWKHSAFFSKIFNGEITNSGDISQLDHFIYAAKFKPIYPIFMILSLTYILILSAYLILKYNKRKLMVFHFCFGALFFILSAAITDSPTIGGKYLTTVFIISSVINFILALVFYLKLKKGNGRIIHSTF